MKPKTKSPGIGWKPLALLVFLAAALTAVQTLHGWDRVSDLQAWIQSLGAWGPAVYVLITIASVVAAIPVTLPAFLSGILFGTLVGVIVSNIGVTIGACLCFLIARYFARGAVDHLVGKYPWFDRLDRWNAAKRV